MVEFVKLMAELNQDIKPYVVIGTITAEQYKQFTGQDYAPAAATPAVQLVRQLNIVAEEIHNTQKKRVKASKIERNHTLFLWAANN